MIDYAIDIRKQLYADEEIPEVSNFYLYVDFLVFVEATLF